MSELPFQAEYAKSGRAGCKSCGKLIGKDSLRLAVMVQSRHFDGKVPNWFHFECFSSRAKCLKTDDIHGFNNLRWEDQEKIKNGIIGNNTSATVAGNLAADVAYKDYLVEYAKSNRSTCRGCGDKIEKGLLRLSHKEFDSERAMYGPQDAWYHLDCFVNKRIELGFAETMDPSKIPGFNPLRNESKEELIKKLGKGSRKKRKADSELTGKSTKKSKEDMQEEITLQAQNELVWQIRDTLQGNISVEALKGLLQYNKQELASGESKLLDCLSDAMAFGALLPCPECGGQLRLSGSTDGYRCTGNVTGWTKCQYVTLLPKRIPFKVPVEFHDVPFLKSYKYVQRQRVFPKSQSLPPSHPDAKVENKNILSNVTVGFLGRLGITQGDATKIIEELGGVVSKKKCDPNLTFIISTEAELNKQKSKTRFYKEKQIPAVSEEFLDILKNFGKEDLMSVIKKHCISDWEYNIGAKIKENPAKDPRKDKYESMFTKSVPSKMKVSVKGGAAVDPDSGLEDKAHVLLGENKNDIFNVVLGLVDISKGTNSFYKLQLLEADKGSKWWVFRAWGRVGTTIGGNKLEKFSSKESAVDGFKALFEEKTGNSWQDRNAFIKFPNKFYPLDIDYGVEDAKLKDLSSCGSSSKLRVEVQDLIRLIFDVENMKRALLEFEIDLKKMPLGKLSKKQIESAFKILGELQKLVDDKETSTKMLDASNRFYTLIPHDFGLRKPPLLDSTDIIKNKIEMLTNMLEIEFAYNLIATESIDSDKDILDNHYDNLKADIKVLDKNSQEYQRILQYVKNTHGVTHNQYDLEVMDVFVLSRQSESKTYKPFKDLHNRMLLWHGSRLTNFVGIISQGLRIAPPEAPVTGYMFGKGIYFADMVSKSANYCMTSESNPIGLMLLSEVALGNMYELTNSEFVEKLPKGKHSTKGLGRTAPDPRDNFICDDGVIIPMGKGMKTSTKKTSLLYNEYIVYDSAQVNLKYLIKMNFKYR